MRWNGNAGCRNGPKPPGVTPGVTKMPSKINAVTPVTPVTATRGVYMSAPVNEDGTGTHGYMCVYHRYHRYTPLYLSIYLIEKERKKGGNGKGNGEVTPGRSALPTRPFGVALRPVPFRPAPVHTAAGSGRQRADAPGGRGIAPAMPEVSAYKGAGGGRVVPAAVHVPRRARAGAAGAGAASGTGRGTPGAGTGATGPGIGGGA